MSDLSSEIGATETLAPTEAAEPTKKEKQRAALAKARAVAAANRAAKKKAAPSNAIPTTELQAAGITIKLADGTEQHWTIPAETEDDKFTGGHQSILDLKKFKGYDPRFTYEFHHDDEIASMYTDEWVGVTRSELGLKSLPSAVVSQYGSSTDDFYRIEKMLCMKKPKVLVDRTHKRMDDYRKAVVGAMKPVSSKRADGTEFSPAKDDLEQGGLVKEEIREHSTFHEPGAIAR